MACRILGLVLCAPFATHYEALGVEASASPEQLRAAWRDRAKQFHPDKQEDRRKNHPDLAWLDAAEANRRVKAVNTAYEVLSDATQREAYDLELAQETVLQQVRRAAASTVGSAFAKAWETATARRATPEPAREAADPLDAACRPVELARAGRTELAGEAALFAGVLAPHVHVAVYARRARHDGTACAARLVQHCISAHTKSEPCVTVQQRGRTASITLHNLGPGQQYQVAVTKWGQSKGECVEGAPVASTVLDVAAPQCRAVGAEMPAEQPRSVLGSADLAKLGGEGPGSVGLTTCEIGHVALPCEAHHQDAGSKCRQKRYMREVRLLLHDDAACAAVKPEHQSWVQACLLRARGRAECARGCGRTFACCCGLPDEKGHGCACVETGLFGTAAHHCAQLGLRPAENSLACSH